MNGLDSAGELPLVIAAKKYTQEENYPGEILKLLHEYGACYLLDNSKGEEAQAILRQFPVKTGRLGLIIRIESFLHMNSGCGLPLNRCTSRCREESKHYSAEFKARIALESLATELTSKELAKKHQVAPWEVIKWRWQARERIIDLFSDDKKNLLEKGRQVVSSECSTDSNTNITKKIEDKPKPRDVTVEEIKMRIENMKGH